MRETRNECVDCDLRRCAGCPYLEVDVLVCDKCGDEVSELYAFDGDELCESCYLDALPSIELMDYEFDEDVRGFCEDCGCDAEKLYNVDDEWLCEACALRKGEI